MLSMQQESRKNHNELKEELKLYMNKTTKNKNILGTVTTAITKLITENSILKEENKSLKERLVKLEYHQRQNNLVFSGYPEKCGETEDDCVKLIRDTLMEIYKVTEEDGWSQEEIIDKIQVNWIHRYGKFNPERHRPIIINLQSS